MKKITLFSLLCLYSTISFSQNGFSLSAGYGLGSGYERKAKALDQFYSYAYYPWSFSANTSHKFDMAIRYKTGHWILQTGIGYWKDGYTRSSHHYYIIYSGGGSGLPGPVEYLALKQVFNYRHITIPFSLGYQFGITKKLSVTPSVGVAVANNMNSSIDYSADTTGYTRNLSRSDFNKGYKRTSWWATAQLDINYIIAPRWTIFLGPHFADMFTNMVKNEYWTYEQSSFKLYNITMNVGILWSLQKKKGAAE